MHTPNLRGATMGLVLGLLVAGCDGGGPQNPPSGGFFRMKVWEAIQDGLGNQLVFELGGMGLLANHVDDWDMGAVGNVFTFATITDRDGEAFSPSDPRLPAIWKFFASTGPCAGQQALGETVVYQNSVVPLTCLVIRGPLSFGFLRDGTPVYTGGDDKMVEG